jgi:hypothetical protein
MRILPFIALNLVCYIASSGFSSDVAYKLDESTFARPEASISIHPCEFTIVDRTWAAPGVEQSSQDLLPPIKFDFDAAPRIRIVHDAVCTDTSLRLDHPHLQVRPEWLDDVAWPLTRELYGLGRPYDGWDNNSDFTFGTLQR